MFCCWVWGHPSVGGCGGVSNTGPPLLHSEFTDIVLVHISLPTPYHFHLIPYPTRFSIRHPLVRLSSIVSVVGLHSSAGGRGLCTTVRYSVPGGLNASCCTRVSGHQSSLLSSSVTSTSCIHHMHSSPEWGILTPFK